MAQYAFGFLETPHSFADENFELSPRKAFERAVETVREQPTASGRWFYPPLSVSPSEEIYLPVARYNLPSTHLLITANRPYEIDYGEYLVLILGFLFGLRLTIENVGHLRPTPLREGELVNFVPTKGKEEFLFCLAQATKFWDAHPPDVRKLMFGAVHWYLVAQSYDSQHERFAWIYTVLDNLHRVAWHVSTTYQGRFPSITGNHGTRPIALADVYGLPLPAAFSDHNSKMPNVAALIKIRNELIHEARWAGEPLGYAVSGLGHDMIEEMEHFCSQIILGLLDVTCDFRNAPYSRQVHGLDVIW